MTETKEPKNEFEGHVSYTQQAKNSAILTTAKHGCMNWHAEVCEKIENHTKKKWCLILTEGVDRTASAACPCACHWLVFPTPMTPPKAKAKKGKKNGR